MKTTWPTAIPLLLASEGPELNLNPPGTPKGQGEPGGASRYGVSVDALSDLHKRLGLPPVTVQTIRDLTESQASDFYLNVSAPACRFDDLPAGVDYVMLDADCTLGPSGGAWLLQNVLGQWPLVSKVTDEMVSLCQSADPRALIWALGSAWIVKKRMQGEQGWIDHGHGWNNRMVRVRHDALAMVGV